MPEVHTPFLTQWPQQQQRPQWVDIEPWTCKQLCPYVHRPANAMKTKCFIWQKLLWTVNAHWHTYAEINRGAKFSRSYATHEGIIMKAGQAPAVSGCSGDGKTWEKHQSIDEEFSCQIKNKRSGLRRLVMRGLRAFWAPLTTHCGQ